jgi:hypothetical protein
MWKPVSEESRWGDRVLPRKESEMASSGERAWPNKERSQEFVDMVRASEPGKMVCFEYHDGESPLTTKALMKAMQWLVESINVLLAVDLDHSVVIASGVLSQIDEKMVKQIVDEGLGSFFWMLSKELPNNVAMVKIDRKGGVAFDPSFHVGVRSGPSS